MSTNSLPANVLLETWILASWARKFWCFSGPRHTLTGTPGREIIIITLLLYDKNDLNFINLQYYLYIKLFIAQYNTHGKDKNYIKL